VITRQHQKGDAASMAVYSPCECYRYELTRVWNPAGRHLAYVMLNPSTATEEQNDPTVERCERRARLMGFGAFRVVNIFAYRATDPRDLKRAEAPVGPDNDAAVLRAVDWADMVIGGWGAHGDHLGQGHAVARMIRDHGGALFHLGLTKAGHPRHPLYIRYDQAPIAWG
jgi:hypothetical protein